MIKLISDGTTGQLEIINGEIETDNSLETPIFISLFGGNVEGVTTSERNEKTVDNLDWFGNLFQKNKNREYFNSLTQKTIMEKPLISGNIKFFEQAVLSDLDWLIEDKIAKEITPEITFTDINSLSIDIVITKPDNTEQKYQYLYEVTK